MEKQTEKEIRYYKGIYRVEVLVKGNRKGKTGPVTWRVRTLEPIKRAAVFYFDGEIPLEKLVEFNGEFVTIPRLLWTHLKGD